MVKIRTLDDLKSVRSYLGRVGAEPRSLKTAVIKELYGGYWKDLAVIRFTKDGEVTCTSTEHKPTEVELADIKAEMPTVTWPQIKPLYSMINPHPKVKEADKENIFEFKDAEGQIIFVQVRVERENGDKSYVVNVMGFSFMTILHIIPLRFGKQLRPSVNSRAVS